MDVLSASTNKIDTRIVYGFPGAGKTTYIQDCIMNDYFHKYGKTLILCFEQGKATYDKEALRERNVHVAYYDSHNQIAEFCLDPIRNLHPDRIYVEMNTKLPDLRGEFPEVMHVTSTVTWFDWTSMEFYFRNSRQMISQMVSESQQITFRGCPSKELLAPYSQEFQLINHRASYLRQDPMGYHEKAFDLFVPYSLDEERIIITAKEYLVFWLDAAEHPEHYEGKMLCFTDPLELRQIGKDLTPQRASEDIESQRTADSAEPHTEGSETWSAGRVVMTCCMADLQFMSFELTDTDSAAIPGGWITMEATGQIGADEYGRKVLKLKPQSMTPAAAPESGILTPAGRNLTGPNQNLAMSMFQRMNTPRS